jgi:hypothetical protein
MGLPVRYKRYLKVIIFFWKREELSATYTAIFSISIMNLFMQYSIPLTSSKYAPKAIEVLLFPSLNAWNLFMQKTRCVNLT